LHAVFTLTLVFPNTHESRNANGDRYDGEWKDGERHGKGTCAYANGDRYTGKWVDDPWSGVGQMNKKYVTVTSLLFVNSDAFVNMIHVHTDTPLGKC
jgi:hypothetical protein